jgi:DHA1 family multidrug resistance protein-like MFS transporter
MLQRSILAIGVAMALTAFATSAWHVLACRVLFGLLGGFTVSSIAAVTASTPRREMAAALGSFQAAQTLGLVAGPLLGGLLADTVGVRAAFLVSGLFFMPALLVVQRLYRDIPPGSLDAADGEPAGPTPRASLFQVLRAAPALLLVMATLYFVNFAEAGLGPLMPLLLARAGAPPESLATVAGATVSAASLGAAVSSYAFGRLAGRLGPRRSLLPILLGGALCTALLALAAQWWQLAAGRVLLGLVVGGAPTLVYATAAQLGGSQRGAAMGFVSSAGLLGFASGPLATGASARLAPTAVYAVVAAAYTLAAALTALRRR